jgi:quinoprotein glucose dehydrogenase
MPAAEIGRLKRAGVTAAGLLVLAPALVQGQVDWPEYGGPGSSKYSPLARITPDNVGTLEIAWQWESGEERRPAESLAFPDKPIVPGKFQGTPVAINDTLYVSTSYSAVVAIDGRTGSELWRFDPEVYAWGPQERGCRFCHRGVAVWSGDSGRRIFINARWRLFALDSRTGEPIASFGDGGSIDLTEDLLWEVNRLHYLNTSPPVVYRDLVITGSGMPDNRVYPGHPPGDIQAFDVRTGERVWTFHTIPQPGELGNETWEDDSWSFTGATNVWGPFTVDHDLGMVYLPVGTPNNDFYGGNRKGDNLFAESVVALDADTGERVWHFQTVHHGIWDYDLPAAPNVVDIVVDGRPVQALAVVAKTGFTYVFDRVTGEPVWPIEERAVPVSDIPGERSAPTQPFPTKPAPFARQGFTEDDLIDFTPELRAEAAEVVRAYRMGALFDPPTLQGTLMFPGVWGGANWGGAAVNPTTGVLYVRGTDWPQVFRIVEAEPGAVASPYVMRGGRLSVADGLPVHKPPYATLTAIDLNSGEHLWQVPAGDMPSLRAHPALAGIDIPPTGEGPPEHGTSGPLVTASGLVFLSGAAPSLFAYDEESGELLWEQSLGGSEGYANPMTYETREGRQYLVIGRSNADGSEAGLTAFALPRR